MNENEEWSVGTSFENSYVTREDLEFNLESIEERGKMASCTY